jgi:hypothetical protein
MAQEKKYISAFNVNENGTISIRQTTEIIENEQVISSTFWRCVLQVNDPMANEILDSDYLKQAKEVWSKL